MAVARQQSVNLPKEIEFIPIHKKTRRRICNPKSNPEMVKYFKISAPDYSFGPFYTESESNTCKDAKKKAWAKIIEKERIERKKMVLKNIKEEMKKWKKEEEKKMRENKESVEKLRENKNSIEKEITEWEERIEKEGTEKEGTEWKKIIEEEGGEGRNKVELKIIQIGRTEWKKIIDEKGTEEEDTNQTYLEAISSVENEAKAAYGGDPEMVKLTESEFRWKMIKDGCFFLQVALSLLNASVLLDLNYPDDDLIFGKKQSTRTFMKLIKSMFLVGNQIPLVVLCELMNQECFRTIIDGVQRWERPSDMLSKQILYDLLVDPVITKGKSSSSKYSQTSSKLRDLGRSMACWSIHAEKPTYYSSHKEIPSDLLHGLQLFLLGPAHDRKAASLDEGGELPDEGLKGDLEAGFELKSPNPEANISEEQKKLLALQEALFKKLLPRVNGSKEEHEKNKQLSASNLAKKGIFLCNNSEGRGSRGIDFKSRILWGRLFIPPLKINRETNVLFTNLKYYEIVHQQKEVRSYINFLANLVSTYEDLNVLAAKKIIDDHTESEDKERFLEMLGNLSDKEEVLITYRHRSVMGRVKDYSIFPWHYFKFVVIVGFVVAVIQTAYAILSYKVGVKQLHQEEFGFNSTGRKFLFP